MTEAVVGHKAALQAYFDGIGFDRWAAIYGGDALSSRVRRSIRVGHTRMLEQATAWVVESMPVVSAGAKALDAGCGTGLFSLRLAAHGYHVTAADIAPRMVSATTNAAREAHLLDQMTFHTGDLAGVEGHFDLVACFDVLVHYPEPDFAAMLTALAARSRGPLLITYAPYKPLLAALHWVGGRFPQGNRRTEIQMVPDRFVARTLADAGFRVHRTARVDHGFYHVTLLEAHPETNGGARNGGE